VRVLLVNDLMPPAGGGAEVVLDRQAGALRLAGDDVRVFAGEVVHRGPGRLLDLWDPFSRRNLARVAAEFGPEVVHHHNVLRELSVSVVGVPRRVPQVMTVHDSRLLGVDDGGPGRLRSLVARRVKGPIDEGVIRRRVDALVAVSEGLATSLTAAGYPNVVYVPVPGDAGEMAHPAPSESEDIVYVGRLALDKGVGVLADAFTALMPRWPGARLVLAGDGPLRARLDTMAAAAPGRLRVLGQVPPADVPSILGQARVVVIPSRASIRPEGAPLAAVDGAMAGRPIVASDDPGLVELAAHLPGMHIVPEGDPVALAAAICSVLADPAAADRRGAANQHGAAGRHSPAAGAAQLHDLYQRLAGGDRVGRG
jgi:glycosyltransferase involved in cell wall biosynthesis